MALVFANQILPFPLFNQRRPSLIHSTKCGGRAASARQDKAFRIAAFFDQVFRLIAMTDAGEVLLDDRPVIEDFSYIMAGGADQPDTSRESMIAGFRSGKCGRNEWWTLMIRLG
jgi:hypothetical protein